MHSVAIWIFYVCLGLTAYVYFGYPILLASGLLARRKDWTKREIQPILSVIVAAYNEQAVIEEKLTNLLASDYPAGKLEILVASDGSTDGTERIVARYADRGVRLVPNRTRRGKSSAQNDAVNQASGEILIFTDADCRIAPATIRKMIENFADASIGLVTGMAVFSNSEATSISRNEGIYARYEAWIRGQESARGILAAASGSIFAVRRSLWHLLNPNVGDDFVLPIQVALQGFRNILDPTAEAWTRLPTESTSMFRVKKRIVTKDLRGLILNWPILNPVLHCRVAVGLWSHKLLRWLVAYFLCGMVLANLVLIHSVFFQVILLVQVAFYGLALTSLAMRSKNLSLPWSVASSFCLVNLAAMCGVFEFIAQRSAGQWKPVR